MNRRPLRAANTRRRWSAILTVAALWAAGGATAATTRPLDVAGFQGARWGMTETELEKAFAGALKRLPAPWEYAGAYAPLALFDVDLAGLSYTAFFQIETATGRLQQVLLERRRSQATPVSHERTLAALTRLYGPPDRTCRVAKVEREPMIAGAVWRFPTTMVHVRFLDFHTTAVFTEDPNRDRDARAPTPERNRNNWRFAPRRVLVRLHPTTRADLAANDCGEDALGPPKDP